MTPDRVQDKSAENNSLIEEIKALRDSTEELFILLEHIWQNRDDLRHKANVLLTGREREALAESLYCYACEMESPDSLAQALLDGWIDVQYEPEDEAGANFSGWCPGCQRAHEAEERRLNEDPPRPPLFRATTGPSSAKVDQRAESSVADPCETGSQVSMPREQSGAAISEAARTDPAGTAAPPPRKTVSPASDRHRTRKPLYLRLYLHRHLEEIVRAIGYDAVSQEEVHRRLAPLIERYGRDTIDPAAEELLAVDTSRTEAAVTLKPDVRNLAWQILGPPPESESDATAVQQNRESVAASDDIHP